MRIRRDMVVAATIAMVLTACGGDDAASTTTSIAGVSADTTATTAAEATTTTAAPTTTTAAPTTTAAAAAASADCVVGTWELDSEAFIAQVFASEEETGFEELGEVEISHGGGAFLVTMNADGTYTGDRDNWQIRLSTDEGTFVNTLDGEETGTWSVDGDLLTVTSVSSTIDVSFAAEIDGQLQELPFGSTQTMPSRELGGSGRFTCDGDSLEVELGGTTSTFTRR